MGVVRRLFNIAKVVSAEGKRGEGEDRRSDDSARCSRQPNLTEYRFSGGRGELSIDGEFVDPKDGCVDGCYPELDGPSWGEPRRGRGEGRERRTMGDICVAEGLAEVLQRKVGKGSGLQHLYTALSPALLSGQLSSLPSSPSRGRTHLLLPQNNLQSLYTTSIRCMPRRRTLQPHLRGT